MASSDTTPLLQAAVIPYRNRGGRPEFCLITSIRRGTWGFPKGVIDPGETPEETALKEAQEEAGLRGRIIGEPLGQYEYRKWGTSILVTVYLMQVAAADDDWEEADLRDRSWLSAAQAQAAIDRNDLRALLDTALDRIESEGP